MDLEQFIPKNYAKSLEKGSFSWQSPSNIALVKYWGKHGEQLPENASVSFTLSNCHTRTTLHFEKITGNDFDFEVYLDGKRETGFEPKIKQFFARVEQYLPFLKEYRFRIETTNSFPHSSGIASSASGMSALACCLVEMERQMCPDLSTASPTSFRRALKGTPESYFNQKASFLARLGSGSAARSIEGPLVVWGEHTQIGGSSNLFGTPYSGTVHANFKNYQDTILLVDKGEKQVSSTVGHNLMHGHPYAQQRFAEANRNLTQLAAIFESGDLDAFIKIVESEALQLHAMMMTSMPYFILMKPNTLEIINRIWAFRNRTKSKVCFTLDAGANVHVLYPENEKATIVAFIETELAPFCKNGEFILDKVGLGAKQLF